MTKHNYRIARVTIIFMALTLSSACFLLYSMQMANTSINKQNLIVVGPPIGGEDVTLAQAQLSSEVKINLPSTLGTFAQMKLDKHSDTLTVIFAENKPLPNASIDEVIKQNGIVFIERPNNMTAKDSTQNIMDAVAATQNDTGSLQIVNINGNVGCAGGNISHNVFWYTSTISYELIANVNYPLDQLFNTAKSIPTQ